MFSFYFSLIKIAVVDERFLVTGVPIEHDRRATRERLLAAILETFFGSAANANRTAVHITGIVNDQAVFIVHSQRLVDLIMGDPNVFHATGHMPIYRYPPVVICSTCASHGHRSDTCTSSPRCTDCGMPGHTAVNCSSQTKRCITCSNDPRFSSYTRHSTTSPLCAFTLQKVKEHNVLASATASD